MVDIASLSIVLVILVAFCTPFIYAHQKKKKHEGQLFSSFMTTAKEHQLHIGSFELWRRAYVISLDNDLYRLLHIKFHPEVQMKLVDLKYIKSVHLVNDHRLVGPNKVKVTDKLGLLLIHEDQKFPDTYLEFYNAEENIDLLGEPVCIRRWQNIIEKALAEIHQNSSDNQFAPELKPSEV